MTGGWRGMGFWALAIRPTSGTVGASRLNARVCHDMEQFNRSALNQSLTKGIHDRLPLSNIVYERMPELFRI